MPAAGGLDTHRVLAEQGVDIVEVLHDGDAVALLLQRLVPLVVVVKDEGDDVIEILDEAVVRGILHQPVEAVIEVREVVKARIDARQQLLMLGADRRQAAPERGVGG